MKKLKSKNIVQLVLNILAIGLIAAGIVCSFKSEGFELKTLYLDIGYLLNLIVALFALIAVVFNIVRLAKKKPLQCSVIYAFDLMVTVLALAVVLFNVFYARPNHSTWAEGNIARNCMVCSFYFTPAVLFIVNFLFFETEKVRGWGYSLLAPVLFVVYSGALILSASMGWLKSYYGDIFNITRWFNGNDWWKVLIMFVVIIIGGFGVGFGLLAINHVMSKKDNPKEVIEQSFAGGEPVTPIEETKPVEVAPAPVSVPVEEDSAAVPVEPEIKPEPKKVKKAPAKKAPAKAKPKKEEPKKAAPKAEPKKAAPVKKPEPEKVNTNPGVYHISKRNDNNQWQVKLANGKKAIKFFKTQGEAVEYAKQLTETQGGSIRVHSLKGTIKKVN